MCVHIGPCNPYDSDELRDVYRQAPLQFLCVCVCVCARILARAIRMILVRRRAMNIEIYRGI